jgi:HTH-type transcriptional regulator/antitoxin HigA
MLLDLMEQRGLRQADLVPIFHSREYVSDVIHGKRGISKAHAKGLAEFFGVAAEIFI